MKLMEWTGRPQVHIVGLFVSLLAAAAVFAFMVGTLEYTKTRGKLLLTAFLVCGYFVTMLASTGIPFAGPRRWLRGAVQALASCSLFLLLLGLWGTPDSDAYWKAAATATLASLGLVLAGLATRAGLNDPVVRALALGSAGAACLLTATGALGIALEISLPLYWWVFGLLVAFWIADSVAIPLAAYLRRKART